MLSIYIVFLFIVISNIIYDMIKRFPIKEIMINYSHFHALRLFRSRSFLEQYLRKKQFYRFINISITMIIALFITSCSHTGTNSF